MFYYNNNFLICDKNMYIYNALISHIHSAFSLSIFEYIDILNLSKGEAKKMILE
jgi:hypothetical protein